MAFEEEQLEVKFKFENEGNNINVSDLHEFLAALESLYIRLSEHRQALIESSPEEINEETYFDERAMNIVLGNLVKDGAFRRSLQIPNYRYVNYSRYGFQQLQIRRINKESPLVLGAVGCGALHAAVWLIGAVEFKQESTIHVDEDGQKTKDIERTIEFNATTLTDVIEEIRKFFR